MRTNHRNTNLVKQPAEILLNEFMAVRNMTGYQLALFLHTPRNRVYEILNGHNRITAEMALRLAKCFSTTAEFWMNLQTEYELGKAKEQFSLQIENEVTTYQAGILPNQRKQLIRELDETERQKILDGLNGTEKRIYFILSNSDKPVSYDNLYYETSIAISLLSATLTMLELSEIVERAQGDSYTLARRMIPSKKESIF